MRSVGALAVVLTAGLGGLGEAGFDAHAMTDFQAMFTPVIVQQRQPSVKTQPMIPPGFASASLGINVHSWQGKVSASSPALGTTVVLQVDYLARYVAYTFTKAATPANPIKAEGCLKVTWPEGMLPPPPPATQVEQATNQVTDQSNLLVPVTVDGEKCIAAPPLLTGGGGPAFSAKDSHLVLLAVNVHMLEHEDGIPAQVKEETEAIPPEFSQVGLKFFDYKSPMEPLKELTCVEGQEAAAIETLADPHTKAFVAALEAHFQSVSRVVGGRSGHPLPAVNLTQALLSARRSTAISLKERDYGSSWVTAAFAIVALVATVAAAAFAAGARTGRRAEAPSYQHLLA